MPSAISRSAANLPRGLAIEQVAQEPLMPQRVAERRTLANPVELGRERLSPGDVVAPCAHWAMPPGRRCNPLDTPRPLFGSAAGHQ